MVETLHKPTDETMQNKTVIPLRNITDVFSAQQEIIKDPENLVLNPCVTVDDEGNRTECQNYRPDLQIPCALYLNGMSEVWPIGMHCMETRKEIVLMDLSQDSEIE